MAGVRSRAPSDGDVRVTSDRLVEADVANRMFPKVRSWFALGAPLELLSPLSVARIVALAALGTWPTGIVLGSVGRTVGLLLAVVSLGVTLWLSRLRALGHRQGVVLMGAFGLMMAASMMSSAGPHRTVVFALVFATMAIYAGLFIRGRSLFLAMLAVAVTLALVARFSQGGIGVATGGVMATFGLLLGAMTAMTVRTARISGSMDPETGLSNMRGMSARLSQRNGEFDTITATVHLRGVAEVRDALGHHAGSELVCRAVEDLGQVLPSSAVIGRGADDDVVVLIENREIRAISSERLAERIVEQIDRAIGTGRYLVGDVEVALNTHIGIAIAEAADVVAPIEILRQSALAARTARDAGRLVSTWNGESTTLTVEDLELLAALRTAADRGELWIAYQPQVRTPDGRTVSVEALLRWSSERHGIISPARFIPLAERTGLVDRLTDWVLGEALDAQARWVAEGLDVTVSVNVSPLSLRSVDFAERVTNALRCRDLEPGRLMLEVTESMAFDVPEAVERLGPLRDLGVRISIDDFGTGYTSLSVLPQLPLDELKVDQQFVREAQTSPASEAIVRSVCELAHRLGLSAVAEGVEDETLAHLMTTFGFDLLQGYHFARPMPEADLLERVRAQDRLMEPADIVDGARSPVELSVQHTG